VIRNLESKAAYIVGLANDIYTVEKEMAKGEVNNMVLVLMHEESIDFDGALARAVEPARRRDPRVHAALVGRACRASRRRSTPSCAATSRS
jgi:hypothetical protein